MSPAATVTIDEAEQLLLAAADDLFYTNGIAAVTMADLRDRSGVSMRRLYQLFPAKSDVITGWLTDRHQRWIAAISAEIDDRIADGSIPVDAVFGAVESWMVDTDFRGCGFINTHAERSEFTEAHAEVIRDHKVAFDSLLTSKVPDVPGLAVLVDGAIVQASIFENTDPIRAAHQLVQKLMPQGINQ